MKTAREWFETFPEPYRSQAIYNCLEFTMKYDNASIALGLSFCWRETNEGHEYWMEFYDLITWK